MNRYEFDIIITNICGYDEYITDWWRFVRHFRSKWGGKGKNCIVWTDNFLHKIIPNLAMQYTISEYISLEMLASYMVAVSFGDFTSLAKPECTDLNRVLSNRELQVLEFLYKGFSCKNIGFYLGLATKTIYSHKHNAMEKLGIRNKKMLVDFFRAFSVSLYFMT